jgi:hypothetical protein
MVKTKNEFEGFQPITCACCTECYLDPRTQRCITGGPYEGYRRPDGAIIDREDNVLIPAPSRVKKI